MNMTSIRTWIALAIVSLGLISQGFSQTAGSGGSGVAADGAAPAPATAGARGVTAGASPFH